MSNLCSLEATRRRSGLNSGLDLVELLSMERSPVTLTQLASRAGMSKSGVHALLATLLRRGYVERVADGGYRLGLKAFEVGCGVARAGLGPVAAPHMTALVREIAEGAILGMLDGSDVVYIHLVESPQPVRVNADLGDRIPAHCTSTGLALLSALADRDVEALLPDTLEAKTSETITDKAHLLEELRRIRLRGYAVNRGGWRLDVGGVAAVVSGAGGDALAALCVAVPRYRMTKEWLARVTPALIAAAGRIGDAARAGSAGDPSRPALGAST
jgi:DNA-binding IclR family transcriptional regulator